MRHQGGRLVEARAFRCGKGVVATRIEVELDVVAALESSLDLLARRGGCVFVEFGEMEDHRSLDLAGFRNIGLDADAVIADRAVHVGSRGDEVSEFAAEAETERTDLAFAFGAG